MSSQIDSSSEHDLKTSSHTEPSFKHSLNVSQTDSHMDTNSISETKVEKYPETKYDTDLQFLLAAIDYAAFCHRDQRRKDSKKTPYINHPIDVANFLAQHGVKCVKTLSGAALHDVTEDTEGTYDDIAIRFGFQVANYVAECSDDKDLDKVQRKRLQIEHAEHISNEAKLIKLGDKYSNVMGLLVTPPSKWSKEEIIGYVYWAFAVCKKLFGVNESIDAALILLFKGHKINTDISDEDLQIELEKYYKVIDKSE